MFYDYILNDLLTLLCFPELYNKNERRTQTKINIFNKLTRNSLGTCTYTTNIQILRLLFAMIGIKNIFKAVNFYRRGKFLFLILFASLAMFFSLWYHIERSCV